jgi:Holliday junction DNA helicase RuvB
MTITEPAPLKLEKYIGQELIRAQLRVWIDRALLDNKPLPHVMMVSPPGMGKTSLAYTIVAELGEPLLQLDLSRMNARRLLSVMTSFESGVIFCDEVHQATKAQQDLLLQVLAEGKLSMPYGGHVEYAWLTFLAATTHPEQLDPAFLRRFKIQLEWEGYSEDEMCQMIQQMAIEAQAELPEEDARSLARATLGVPSAARDLFDAYWALRPSSTVPKALALVNRAPDGLSNQHLRYMDFLRGEQMGERLLAKGLRVHPSVLAEIERVLHEKGYLQFGPTGRMLTPAAYRRLSETKG